MKINRFRTVQLRTMHEFRSCPFLAICAFSLFIQIAATNAFAEDLLDKGMNFDIPENTRLEDALIQWGTKVGMTVMINTSTVDRHLTRGVRGTLSARKALNQLLLDSGLSYTEEGRRIRIVPSSNLVRSGLISADQHSLSGGDFVPSENIDSDAADRQSRPRENDLEEVLITAQKRTERLQDVPVPVSSVDASTLVNNNQLRLEDYFSSVPGLSLAPGLHGEPVVAIRGITTDLYTNPTVAITVDDVPYGSSTGLGGGNAAPDIDPSDLARIEVLRGPQGTLYGASSLGGLIKYVTVDPSTDGVSGHVQAGLDQVHNGSDLGYTGRGSINIPLSDTLAILASGFTRRDAGYLDNVQTGEKNANWAEAYGGRLSALWRPGTDFSIKLSAFFQHYNIDGTSEVPVSGLGDLQQSELRGTGWNNTKTQTYSANVSFKLGSVNVASISGYSKDYRADDFDFTPYFSSSAQSEFGVPGSSLPDARTTNRFTQEIRLSGQIGERFDWLAGAMYDDERSTLVQSALAVDPTTGLEVGTLFSQLFQLTYKEYAAFGDLTIHFTDLFDVQFGGRESDIKQTEGQVYDDAAVPTVSSKANSFTYLVTPRLKISNNLMVYTRLASGYRPGGPNQNAGVAPNIPPQIKPDKTTNYEIGVKGETAGHAVSFDASLYYIDWRDIQLTESETGFSFYANGGRAKSEGAELSMQFRPMTGLAIATWVTLSDAKLTEDFPATSAVVGMSGDRLPFSSRFSGNLSVDQKIAFTHSLSGFVGGVLSYVGDREGAFASPPPPRQDLPGYARADLHFGVSYQSWTVTAYVNNLGDRRGILGSGLTNDTVFYIQPRTAGLSLLKRFE